MSKTVRVAVTGAAGQVAYSMLARLASGEVFGPDTKVRLQLLEITPALTALAKKAGVPNGAVGNVTIWGNHSNTQYPDFTNARINGKPATETITDRAWLEQTFVPAVQTRGAAVIKARGLSSALSAANGAIDHVKTGIKGTRGGGGTRSAVSCKG